MDKPQFVKTETGKWLLQTPEKNPWGFSLTHVAGDDCQTWQGGLGIAEAWESIPDVSVPAEIKEKYQWIIEEWEDNRRSQECSECGADTSDDLDGWDGLCGNCADKDAPEP